MNMDELIFASSGVLVPYVAQAPLTGVPGERSAPVLCIPVLQRAGGFLACLPVGSVPPSLLEQGFDDAERSLHGPSTVLEVPAVEETEEGEEEPSPEGLSVLIVDVSDQAASFLSIFDPGSFPSVVAFDPSLPQRFPQADQLLVLVRDEGARRPKQAVPKPKRVTTAHLATQMALLLDVVPKLTGQLETLGARQKALEEKVALGSCLDGGASPEDRPGADEDPLGPVEQQGLQEAIASQSSALTLLVNHLISQAADSAGDFGSGASGSAALSSRGTAKRERLQAELAEHTGNFMVAVSDLLLSGQVEGALDGLALMQVALEQAAQDGNKWEIAYALSLFPAPSMGSSLSGVVGDHDACISEGGSKEGAEEATVPKEAKGLLCISWALGPPLFSVLASRSPRVAPRAHFDRTPFAAFLSSLLHQQPSSSRAPARSLFPLPWPFYGVFDDCSHLGPRARARVGVRRLTCVTVAALNYLHSGGTAVVRSAMLKVPNVAQARALSYIGSLIRSGSSAEPFEIVSATRRTAELVARLGEVSEHVTRLAPTCDPYGPAFPQIRMTEEEKTKALHPYTDLNPARLKLSGSGQWDPSPFLEDSLYLAFREPQSLLLSHIVPPGPGDVPLPCTDEERTFQLCKIWDAQGLLRLASSGPPEDRPYEAVKIFNAAKDSTTDRQIADRRGRNWCEGRIRGPSCMLPSGSSLVCWHIRPHLETASINATDRKDFYHQLAVPRQRALRSVLLPPLPVSKLRDTRAFRAFLEEGGPSSATRLFPCFGAVLQGDALGVEFACSSHAALLEQHGLLQSDSRIFGLRPFPPGAGQHKLIEGLVIDDYFAISRRPLGPTDATPAAVSALCQAKQVYQSYGILGSDPKDIVNSECAVVAGAELDCSPMTRSLNLALVGPPKKKRLAISAIGLEICRLGATTDHLHLSLLGALTSSFLFRRPLMSLLGQSFGFVDAASISPAASKVLPLPRKVADEITLASILSLLCVSDIAAPWSSQVFATDSSDTAGAVVAAPCPSEVTEAVWTSTYNLTASARMLSRERAALRRVDPGFEEVPEEPLEKRTEQVKRPLALRFNILFLGPGLEGLRAAVISQGLSVGPSLHTQASPEYDLLSFSVWGWVAHLLEEGLIDALVVRPPSSTFALA
ncbi:unnamed protein product, partial [Symbiodinium sp. CCMP2456]